MRTVLSLLLIASPLAGAKKPTPAQMEAQIRRLTEERDSLKERLAATADLQQEIAAARQALDLAKQEREAARKEADRLKSTLQENQGSGDAILEELRQAKDAAAQASAEAARLSEENEDLKRRTSAPPSEGDLVALGEDIRPARPINLNRVTPRLKAPGLLASRPKGVVVVNVLISEKGDVLSARLIQGLPGDAPEERQAGEACVEAAKRIVFDPAASKDGKTRFKVWQGVGFYLD